MPNEKGKLKVRLKELIDNWLPKVLYEREIGSYKTGTIELTDKIWDLMEKHLSDKLLGYHDIDEFYKE